jgi:hypothetical protein
MVSRSGVSWLGNPPAIPLYRERYGRHGPFRHQIKISGFDAASFTREA